MSVNEKLQYVARVTGEVSVHLTVWVKGREYIFGVSRFLGQFTITVSTVDCSSFSWKERFNCLYCYYT